MSESFVQQRKLGLIGMADHGTINQLYPADEKFQSLVNLLKSFSQRYQDLESIAKQAPLSLVVRSEHEAIVKVLLEVSHFNINLKNKEGVTPLVWAARSGCTEVVKLLLNTSEVDVHVKNSSGVTHLS